MRWRCDAAAAQMVMMMMMMTAMMLVMMMNPLPSSLLSPSPYKLRPPPR